MFHVLCSMKKNGFTVIESLVIVVIIAVIITVVISNFPQVKLQFALSRVAYQFAQDVRRAQDKALSQVQYKDSSGEVQAINGYGIYIDINGLGSKKYIIYADSGSGNQQYDSLDYLVETIDFSVNERGVVIKEVNNVSDNKVSINFNFSNFNTTITSLAPNQNSVNIVFALESDLTKTKAVLVNTSGLVEVQ